MAVVMGETVGQLMAEAEGLADMLALIVVGLSILAAVVYTMMLLRVAVKEAVAIVKRRTWRFPRWRTTDRQFEDASLTHWGNMWGMYRRLGESAEEFRARLLVRMSEPMYARLPYAPLPWESRPSPASKHSTLSARDVVWLTPKVEPKVSRAKALGRIWSSPFHSVHWPKSYFTDVEYQKRMRKEDLRWECLIKNQALEHELDRCRERADQHWDQIKKEKRDLEERAAEKCAAEASRSSVVGAKVEVGPKVLCDQRVASMNLACHSAGAPWDHQVTVDSTKFYGLGEDQCTEMFKAMEEGLLVHQLVVVKKKR